MDEDSEKFEKLYQQLNEEDDPVLKNGINHLSLKLSHCYW
tara:strand:- start:208 stop:327 length:120 start_codon:yes stop_codon:yes gene_type:complete